MGIRTQIQNRNRFVNPFPGHGRKGFAWVCIVSMLVHLAFFAGIFCFHDFEFSAPKPQVVRIDLVSFVPGPVGGAAPLEPAPVDRAKPETEAVNLNTAPLAKTPEAPLVVPVLKPEISLKSKPKNIKDLMAKRKARQKPLEKEKTQKLKPKPKKIPEKDLKKAREALAKKVEDQNQEKINQALKRMQAAIDIQGQQPTGGKTGNGQGTGMGNQGSNPLVLYQMVLKSAIEQNWIFNDTMAGINQNLEVRLFIKILKSGEIRDISYETRSGNLYLDESAKKAVRKASPLPELPKGMPSYELVLGFTPRGLN
ncbi:MAG: TonB family protein [Desulfobacter sp.]|nr:TonB family protein [Desulfobacter sp.]